jgi:hypothetical protein
VELDLAVVVPDPAEEGGEHHDLPLDLLEEGRIHATLPSLLAACKPPWAIRCPHTNKST